MEPDTLTEKAIVITNQIEQAINESKVIQKEKSDNTHASATNTTDIKNVLAIANFER